MNGNFTFHNPTRLHFGENAMDFLKDELAAFGPTVMLTYGGYKQLTTEEVAEIFRQSL